jgi:hypothetical protein
VPLAVLVAVVVAALLVVAVVWNATAPSLPRLALCVLLAVAWLPANKPVEGVTLFALGRGRGVTVSDLLSIAAVAAAVSTWLMARRQCRASHDDEWTSEDEAPITQVDP